MEEAIRRTLSSSHTAVTCNSQPSTGAGQEQRQDRGGDGGKLSQAPQQSRLSLGTLPLVFKMSLSRNAAAIASERGELEQKRSVQP